MQRLCVAARAENQAAAEQLEVLGQLFAYRYSSCAETDDWAIDTEAAVAAEVGAALRISQGLAASRLRYARAMLAHVATAGRGAVFTGRGYRLSDLCDDCVSHGSDHRSRRAGRRGCRRGGQCDPVALDDPGPPGRPDRQDRGPRRDADAAQRRATRPRPNGRSWDRRPSKRASPQIIGSLFTVDAPTPWIAAVECVGGHGVRPRSAHPRPAPRRCPRGAGRRRGAAGLSLRALPTAPRSHQPRALAGDHPRHRRTRHPQRDRNSCRAPPAQCRRADHPRTDRRTRQVSQNLVPLIHPGDAPPEPGYIPSKALADFVRARDLTCRWPGCDVPAVNCQLDHTIPHAQGGPTHAGNLKCYCPTHHLLKTFWGWREKQLPDGTLILTSPAGHTYVTTPGSALLFPSLCHAVGMACSPEADPPARDHATAPITQPAHDLPKRRRTRTQDRANRVATERRQNRDARMARTGPAPPDDDPPPF